MRRLLGGALYCLAWLAGAAWSWRPLPWWINPWREVRQLQAALKKETTARKRTLALFRSQKNITNNVNRELDAWREENTTLKRELRPLQRAAEAAGHQ